MKNDARQQMFTRRALIFGTIQIGAVSALAARLYYLQFIHADEYKTLSESNRIKLQLVPPLRGSILDRNGEPLAYNEKNYRLLMEVNGLNQSELEAQLRKVSDIVPLGEKRIKQIMNEVKAWPFSPPMQLKDHLSWEELSKIELNKVELPGVDIDVGQVRYYPFGAKASHLTGYVGAVAKNDMTDQPLLRLPDFKIGKSGVEKMLEDRLRGSAGVKNVEVNVHGLPVRELSMQPSVPGENVRLTIDARLQDHCAKLLEGQSGSVAVMNVRNGNLLALVTVPGYDPNSFSKGIASAYWKQLMDDPMTPLLNKGIAGQYPPGSTFKMLVGLAGLESGLTNIGTRVFCPGHFFLGNHRFNCWKEGGHGTVDLINAVAMSCDTFFYTVAQKIGIDAIASMARRFGLGVLHDFGIPGEKPGIIPDNDWKMKRYKQRWQAGDTINAGIGQGYVLATPLQLAVMTARMVNGGYAVKPRLVEPANAADEPTIVGESMGINPAHLRLVVEGMSAVSNAPNGTAYGKRITEPRFAMGGKTGTSQVRKILKRGVDQNTLPWKYRHHALFVGFAPVESPVYAVSVFVEHGGGGSSAAAPIARDVLLKLQQMEEEAGHRYPPINSGVALPRPPSAAPAPEKIETTTPAPAGQDR